MSTGSVITYHAEYRIEIAWASQVDNPFTFGTSTLGGGDVLVDTFLVDFLGDNDDVSLDCDSFSIKRGRDDPLTTIQAGTCDLVLFNEDGLYNPENTSSPLYGLILPMRQVRVIATYDGVDYHLYRGFIRSVDYEPVTYQTRIRCEDLFLWLSRFKPVISERSGTTGELIEEILLASGWTLPGTIHVPGNMGDQVPTFSLNGENDARTALQGIADLLESERGLFYIHGDGVAHYHDRHFQATRQSTLTLTDQFVNSRPGVDLDSVVNVARVKRGDNPEQEAINDASVQFYGPSSVEITSDYFEDDGQALALAQYLVAKFGDPVSQVWAMPMIAGVEENVLIGLLLADIGDRITIVSSHAAIDGDYYIESIEHNVRVASKHEVNWTLSRRPEADDELFVFGTSTLGGGDILAYY